MIRLAPLSWLVVAAALLAGAAAAGAELPPAPQSLRNAAAMMCLKIGDDGRVTGLFLIHSTGDAAQDSDWLAWARKLHWDAARPGARGRNVWLPMSIAFGTAKAEPAPSTCAPSPVWRSAI